MKRLYNNVLKNHFEDGNKMAFLAGPRQVGKTTTSNSSFFNCFYLNWDNQEHKKVILSGPSSVFDFCNGSRIRRNKISIVFDEIHKYPKWKTFLKGFYDTYKDKFEICVTGSARLDLYKYGGDSLMGRYFLYRMHPLSIRELTNIEIPLSDISKPRKISGNKFQSLLRFGGYPEPFLKNDLRFYNKWKRLRLAQLFNEDLRDLSRITDIGRIKLLAERLSIAVGSKINYSNLANEIQVSVDTIRRWLSTLELIYYSFRVKPYSKNITRAILKEPKIYLWDWSMTEDEGKRNENFIASHLLKAVDFYNDSGFGNYDLFYLKDKDKREVDFLVTKNSKPWFLVEVKTSKNKKLNPSLKYFKDMIKADHAFQVTINMEYEDVNCFKENDPVIVPAKTLLSQLV